MTSLMSPNAKRISGRRKFRLSAKKDFFDIIGAKRALEKMELSARWREPDSCTAGNSRVINREAWLRLQRLGVEIDQPQAGGRAIGPLPPVLPGSRSACACRTDQGC